MTDQHTVLTGDAAEVMATLPPNTFDAMLCDPPYGLRFMGKAWDYDVPTVATWREALRVLKPGAYALVACGTRTQHRMVVNLEDAGFEVRDVVAWLYGSGFPKSHDVSKAIDRAAGAEREVVGERDRYRDGRKRQTLPRERKEHIDFDPTNGECSVTAPATPDAERWAGYGTALKPAMELWTLVRKPPEGTVAANALKHGVGGLNIDGSRIPTEGPLGCTMNAWDNDQPPCDACAASAAEPSTYGTPATKAPTADAPAKPNTNGADATPQAATNKADTGCSDGTKAASTATSSSTAASGKTPTGLFHEGTKSTTPTVTSLTTGSTTCASCGRPLTAPFTSASTTPKPNGSPQTPDARASTGNAGRWPSNVIHDGSDEVLAGFPDTASGGTPFRRAGMGYHGATGQDEVDGDNGDFGSAARFFYQAKASQAERDGGTPNGCDHPTVKPIALTTYLARLILPPERDTPRRILVPFAGVGSEMIGARLAGWDHATGIEREPEYATIATARLEHHTSGRLW